MNYCQRRATASLFLCAVAFVSETLDAQVVLETRELRLELSADALVLSLTARPGGTQYAWTAAPVPFACVYRGGEMAFGSPEAYAEHQPPIYRGGQCFPASAVSLAGDTLTLRFAQANVTAAYRVVTNAHYLAFKLLSLSGEPIDRIDLAQLRVKRLPYLGPWIDIAYDDNYGVCLCAGNGKTDAGMNQYPEFVEMRAVATREVALEGATAVLFGCAQPKTRFLHQMEIVERDFNMPPGAKNRQSPVQNYSYLWFTPSTHNVDEYITLAKRAGFRMLFFSYVAFTTDAGHFRFNQSFPGGINDLKKVTERIRAAGLKVGIHFHYSKVARTDAYVTPVPDERLHLARSFTLSAPINEKEDTLFIKENPAACTRDDHRRILKLGKELIAYRDYTTEAPYQFTGCERGHLRSAPTSHAAGEKAGLLDVDDWPKFIRLDQDTDIQDEAAKRIAEIINGSGPYDLVYFDGAEDVHDPFWYHVGNAQYRVYHLLQPPPPVCEAAMNTHFGWHFITRANAYDIKSHIKNFSHEISCRTAPVRALDFTRMNFGWILKLNPNTGPDELEYVLSRGAAWDCPFSIRLSPEDVAANPRGQDCLDVIRLWEEARIAGKLGNDQKQMLQTQSDHQYVKVWDAVRRPQWTNVWTKTIFSDQEHHLFINEQGEHELVPIREIPNLAGGNLRAFVFQRPKFPGKTYILTWAKRADVRLKLPMPAERLSVMRPFGKRLSVEDQASPIVDISSRRYLEFTGVETEQAIQILRRAVFL